MAKHDEGRISAIQARTFAIMLVALDGRPSDIEPLLDDLSPEDVGDVVHGLASMALLSMLKREDRRDPAAPARARLGEHLRSLVLERQARAED